MTRIYTPLNIASATTTLVKSGPGILGKIVINTTAAGSITIYDSLTASGTKLATMKASIAEGSYAFDVAFTIGLTIVTAGASDITVAYN
jgi:hypothetical protein